MKTLKHIIFIFILFLSAVSASAQQLSTAALQVTGLTCSMCSKATETSLRTLNFIENVTPDLNKNLFMITFKKDSKVNIDLIKKKVQDAGFSVGSLSTVFRFNQTKVDDKGHAIVQGNVYKFTNVKSKVLNGEVKVTVVDKGFVSASTFKKNASQFKSDIYSKGTEEVNGKATRVYHLSI